MAQQPVNLLAQRAAELKARADSAKNPQASQPAAQATIAGGRPLVSTSDSFYFHASHKTLVILDHNDQKVKFENHFLVTSDKALAEHIKKQYCAKKGGSLKIQEVNHFYYDQSQIIQPVLLPLPSMMDTVFPPEPQPLSTSVENSVVSDVAEKPAE